MLMRVDPFQQIDNLLQTTLNGVRAGVMPMDAYRRGDEFIAEFDVPGVDPGSIDVTVEQNVLQVTARRTAHYDEVDEIEVRERPQGVMTRQVLLADGLDTANISASYDDGVLRLVIPVSEEARPRTIEVTKGSGEGQTAIRAESA